VVKEFVKTLQLQYFLHTFKNLKITFMRSITDTKFMAVVAMILVFGLQAFCQEAPPGYRVAMNYHESFTEAEASFSATKLSPGWVRLKDKEDDVSYSTTRDNGGHKGKAIGHIYSQSNVRSGNNTIELYDYLISPRVKGTVKFWIARYSTSKSPQVEVYRMTKTDSGFSCNPKTDLLFSVSEDSWPQYTNSNSSGWVEQTFNVGDYEYLGFRISCAYIDEFEASSAIVPGTDASESKSITPAPQNAQSKQSDKVSQSNQNKTTAQVSQNKTTAQVSQSKPTAQVSRSNQGKTNTRDTKWESTVKSVVTPYFTANTLFMVTDPSPNRFSQVTDSVFAINTGGRYEFWTVTGQKLYDAVWKMPKDYSSSKPQFDGGVVAMRMAEPNASGQKPICLLYLDGRVKALNPAWKYVSKFEDGLAIAQDERQNWFYINSAGAKMYPSLMVSEPTDNEVRPLCGGLRAFYGRTSKYGDSAWGFIDAEGVVVIPPKYKSVTDFSDGYAWAVTDNYKEGIYAKELIDVRGNVVYKLAKHTAKTRNVTDGVFVEIESQRDVYRDPSGKELASFTEATSFYDGYAFVQTRQMGGNVSLIDRDFQVIRELSNDVLPPSRLETVSFEPFGLYTVGGSHVIAPNGNEVLTDFGTGFENTIGSFGQFSESGYATAEGYIDSERCFFYIKPTGEIAWMFSDNKETGGPWEGGNPPFPTPVPIPPFPGPFPGLDPGQPPRGPRVVETVKFTVTAIADPARGGTVTVGPKNEFEYGESATVNAAANKDWAVASIECSPAGASKVENGKPFRVTGDMTVVVHFLKKDDVTPPEHTGCYLGTLIPPEGHELSGKKEWEIPVYAEIGEKGTVDSPFGRDNYGFLVMMFDPNITYSSAKGDLSCNFFAVPMKISGFQKDGEGRSWMVLDGGSVASTNMSVGDNPLTQMVFGFMLGASGMSTVASNPRHYRVEMIDIDPDTGEFTFGGLQTYSTKSGGWVAGGSKELTDTRKGAFATYYDSGYDADTFDGLRMKSSAKRNDVYWYPPQSWFDNQSLFEKTINAMREGFGAAKSDYERIFSN